MKFYEFNNFEYYALIGANTQHEAISEYINYIADIYEDDGIPDLISTEMAKEKYCELATKGEGTYKKLEEEFYKSSKSEEAVIFLIDGSLL